MLYQYETFCILTKCTRFCNSAHISGYLNSVLAKTFCTRDLLLREKVMIDMNKATGGIYIFLFVKIVILQL